MNINQTKNIPLVELLYGFNICPVKITDTRATYFALNRHENTPSLSVELKKNKAIDYGTGKVYDAVSLVQEIFNCSVSEALKIISEKKFSSFQKQESFERKINPEQEKNYQILKVVDDISNPVLVQYLKKRKILEQKKLLKEIHYQVKNKDGVWRKYFAVGFPNQHENSFEISSPIWKGCLGKKDVVLIKNNSKFLKVTESFFDFLSLKMIEENLESVVNSDYLILNSTALFSKVERDSQSYNSYERIELFLDNDRTGKETTQKFLSLFSQAEDYSFLYRDYKDLNDFLCSVKTC